MENFCEKCAYWGTTRQAMLRHNRSKQKEEVEEDMDKEEDVMELVDRSQFLDMQAIENKGEEVTEAVTEVNTWQTKSYKELNFVIGVLNRTEQFCENVTDGRLECKNAY